MDTQTVEAAARGHVVAPVTQAMPAAALDLASDPRAIGVIVAPPDKPHALRKHYQWLATDHSGNPRHHVSACAGAWVDEAETRVSHGVWKAVETEAAKLENHQYDEELPRTLAEFAVTLNKMAGKARSSLIQGRLRASKRAVAFDGGDFFVAKRDGRHYEDAPTHWFPLDVDGIAVDYDLSTASHQDVDGTIEREIVPALPREFADASFIVGFTQSAGIKGGRNSLRVRLFFLLRTPLTLRQQKQIILEARKRQPALDPGLYSPGHLVFTAPPLLRAPLADGTFVKVPRPAPDDYRVVERDNDVVPNAAPAAVVTTAAQRLSDIADADGLALTATSLEEVLASIGTPEAKYHDPIFRLICSLAWRTPDSQRDATMLQWRSKVRARIIEVSEPSELERRLREHLSLDWWAREWDAALERKASATAQPAPSAPTAVPTGQPVSKAAPATIESVRQQLAADVKRVAGEILGGRALHALVTAAPGTGKTRAVIGLIDEGHLINRRICILVPTHELASELTADLKAHARTLPLTSTFTHDQLADRVRHHKGRTQPGMCINVQHGARAARFETLGVSPRETACIDCPDRGTCPWIAQFGDNEPGVVVTVHAAMRQKDFGATRNFNLFVIDESATSTFIGSDAPKDDNGKLLPPPTIESLALGRHVVRARRRRGDQAARERSGITREFRRSRNLLQDVLRAALPVAQSDRTQHVVKRAAAEPFFATEDWIRYGRDGKALLVEGPRIERALELEAIAQKDIISRLKAEKQVTRQTRDLESALRASRYAETILQAIQASAGRDDIFCVRVFRRAIKDDAGSRRSLECFSVETRRNVPDAIVTTGGLWLDGTADADVWRATLSPNGAPLDSEIITTPKVPVSNLTVTPYVDKPHARSMYATPASVLEDAADEAAQLDAEAANLEGGVRLARSIPWMADAALVAEVNAASKRHKASVARVGAAMRKLRADSNLGRLWRFTLSQALPLLRSGPPRTAEIPKDVLLVAQLDVVNALKKLGLPPNVGCAHFGSLRGLNAYKSVRVAIIAGRPAPGNDALELLTEALHMHDPAVTSITRAATWGTGPVVLETKAGPVAITGEVHPDPLCRAYGRTIAQAEVQQAVARVRAYDRTAATPCEIHVFGQHPTGLVVDTRAHWSDAERPWSQVALANGMLFERPETNQAVYVGLVPAKGDGGAVAAEMRDAWIGALAASVADQMPAQQLPGRPLYKNREGDFDLPNRNWPGSCDAPEVLPGTGLALAVFTLAATRDGAKPQRQHALLAPSVDHNFLAKQLGGPLARFEWLPVTAAMGLLEVAFSKRARKAIEVADKHITEQGAPSPMSEVNAQLYREVAAGQRDWRQVARDVLGWLLPA